MLPDIYLLIIFVVILVLVTILFSSWYPRDQELIIIVSLTFLVLGLVLFFFLTCSRWIEPGIVHLNPTPTEHGHRGFYGEKE